MSESWKGRSPRIAVTSILVWQTTCGCPSPHQQRVVNLVDFVEMTSEIETIWPDAIRTCPITFETRARPSAVNSKTHGRIRDGIRDRRARLSATFARPARMNRKISTVLDITRRYGDGFIALYGSPLTISHSNVIVDTDLILV